MSSIKPPDIPRSTIAYTWKWLWPDMLMRLLPMTIIPFLYIFIFHLPLTFLGLTLHNVPSDVFIGLLVGICMAAFAATYRILFVGPWFRWPTLGDHVVQGAYYLFLNGPIEELFFRGFMWGAVTQWTGWVGWGWLVSTATYILYHRLGNWSWPSVGGVALAGLVFSLLYLAQSTPPSLLTVIIVHSFTTAGFLSWGDEVMYRRWKRKNLRGSKGK